MPKGRRWTNEENETLAMAWLTVSLRQGTKKGAAFWSKVHEEFVERAPKRFFSDGLFEERSSSTIPSHFRQMYSDMEAFHQTLKMCFTKQPRGLTHDERIAVAIQIHLGQATNPNRAFREFDPTEWPNYDAWWIMKQNKYFEIPPFVPATTPEEIAAALAPRAARIAQQKAAADAAAVAVEQAAAAVATVAVVVETPAVAAITPAPQPRSENNSADGDDAQEKEGLDEEVTPGGHVMHTPAAVAAAATPSNINDSNNVAKDAAARKEDDRVDGSDTCDDFGGEETTEWSPTEEAVHSPERNVSEKSPSTDADVLPQSESNATESTMPAIGIESVESAGGNRSPTAVESESSALSAKIDTLLSVVNENIQSNNRKLDLMAYLVLNKGDDENDAVNVKKARTELSELCSAFTVKK